MRSLAKFIMRGRLSAAVIALIGLPLLTPAAIGLVSLRHGPLEGALMVLIGLFPALLSVVTGQPVGPVFWGMLASLLVVYVPSVLLRATVSWSFTLMAMVLILVVGIPFLVFQTGALDSTIEILAQWLNELVTQQGIEPGSQFTSPVFLSGLFAMSCMINGVVGLIIARWWQAMLYNPGGFAEEFQGLKLHWLSSTFCVLGVLFCFSRGAEFVFWASLFTMPLLLVSVGIVHFVVANKPLGKSWLFGFYLSVFLLRPIMVPLLTLIGFIDSWVNLRRFVRSDSKSQ